MIAALIIEGKPVGRVPEAKPPAGSDKRSRGKRAHRRSCRLDTTCTAFVGVTSRVDDVPLLAICLSRHGPLRRPSGAEATRSRDAYESVAETEVPGRGWSRQQVIDLPLARWGGQGRGRQ